MKTIMTYGIFDIFPIGKDWNGNFDFFKEYCEVIYIQRTVGVWTTQLKNSLSMFLSVPKNNLIKAIEALELLKQDLS